MEELKKENTENKIENKDHIPSKAEVLKVISHFIKGGKIVDQHSDDKGPIFIHVEFPGENEGETVQYQYLREGDHYAGCNARETTIETAYFKKGEMQMGAETMALYNKETGQWGRQSLTGVMGDIIDSKVESIEHVQEKENIPSAESPVAEHVAKLEKDYVADVSERNKLQTEITADNLAEVKPVILAIEEDMRDINQEIENPVVLRESGPEVAELESLIENFEKEYPLDILNSINEISLDDLMNHEIRKPAKLALNNIETKRNILNNETNISSEKQIDFYNKYKKLTKAIGLYKEGKLVHYE